MASSWRAGQVLVVEDDMDLREELCELLAFEGHHPIGCRDGRSAWTQLASGLRPDVIVTDLGLPQLSGRELVALVREQTWGKRMPILLLSGWGDATRFGVAADVVIVKGGDPAVFARAVDRLTRWRPQRLTATQGDKTNIPQPHTPAD